MDLGLLAHAHLADVHVADLHLKPQLADIHDADRRLAGGRAGVAGVDVHLGDQAVERRADLGVLAVELGQLERGLGLGHAGASDRLLGIARIGLDARLGGLSLRDTGLRRRELGLIRRQAQLLGGGARLGDLLLGGLDADDFGLAGLVGGNLRLLDGLLGLLHRRLGLHKRGGVGLALCVVELIGFAASGGADFRLNWIVAAILDILPVALRLGVG